MYIPPLTRYRNTYTNDRNDDGATSLNGRQTTVYIGLYRIEGKYLEIGYQYMHMPDFCGGIIVNSPRVNACIKGPTPFGTDMGPGHYSGADDEENWEAVPDVTEHYTLWKEYRQKTGLPSFESDYGYWLICTSLAREMLHSTTMSCILAGVEGEGEVDELSVEWARCRHAAMATYTFGNGPHPVRWQGESCWLSAPSTEGHLISTAVDTTTPYWNPNSGNDVHWTVLRITGSTLFVDDYRAEDEDDEVRIDEYAIGREFEPIQVRTPSDPEQWNGWIDGAVNFINRELWRNG